MPLENLRDSIKQAANFAGGSQGANMRVAILLLLGLSGFFEAGHAQSTPWVWSKKELKRIASIEKSVKSEAGWFEVETKHWLIRTQVDRRFTAELAQFMDHFDQEFSDLLRGIHKGRKVKQKPTVVIYADHARYNREFPGGSRGYYRWSHQGRKWSEFHLYSYIQNQEERKFSSFYHPILIHEGAHILFRTYLGQGGAPLWFDEGMATYFQFWDLRDSPKKNLSSRYSRSIYRQDLRNAYEAGPPTLRTLFDVTTWNPDNMGPQARRNYALAESLVDFMMSSKTGRKIFKRTFQRIPSGTALFTEKEIAQLEPLWQEHIRTTLGLKKK